MSIFLLHFLTISFLFQILCSSSFAAAQVVSPTYDPSQIYNQLASNNLVPATQQNFYSQSGSYFRQENSVRLKAGRVGRPASIVWDNNHSGHLVFHDGEASPTVSTSSTRLSSYAVPSRRRRIRHMTMRLQYPLEPAYPQRPLDYPALVVNDYPPKLDAPKPLSGLIISPLPPRPLFYRPPPEYRPGGPTRWYQPMETKPHAEVVVPKVDPYPSEYVAPPHEAHMGKYRYITELQKKRVYPIYGQRGEYVG